MKIEQVKFFGQVYTELEARRERITAKRSAYVAHLKRATAEKYLCAVRKERGEQSAETKL